MVKYLASKVKHISRSLFDVLKQFNCKLRHSAANSFISSTFAVCTGGSLLSYFNSVFWISLFLFSTFPVLSYQRNNFTKACNFYKKKFFPSWVLVFISIYNLPKTKSLIFISVIINISQMILVKGAVEHELYNVMYIDSGQLVKRML